MISRQITRNLAIVTLATILAGVIVFALTTNEPTPASVTAAIPASTAPDSGGDSASEDADPATTAAVAAETSTSDDRETSASAAPVVAPVAADGPAIYATHCASCHGTNGEGGSGGPVDDLEINLAEVIDITANGVPRMPAYGDVLTPEEVEAVAAYILALGDE